MEFLSGRQVPRKGKGIVGGFHDQVVFRFRLRRCVLVQGMVFP